MRTLFIATGNTNKTREIQELLGGDYEVYDRSARPDLPDVAETGATFSANARLKAVEISRLVPWPVLSDDSGLEVDALAGAPGVYSARYAGEAASSAENNKKLMLKMQGQEERSARFRCVMVLAEAGEVVAEFDGTCEGNIVAEPRGGEGFGYDPLFVPLGNEETFAQLSSQEKGKISHRGKAMSQVIAYLQERYPPQDVNV